MTVVVGAIFLQNNKYYQQVFLGECLYKLQKIMLYHDRLHVSEVTDVNKIKQVHQKSVMFVTIGVF